MPQDRFMFQSLLHQGISLLRRRRTLPDRSCPEVSIPSSSGHQFTASFPSKIAISEIPAFQSLLHQGISLLVSALHAVEELRHGGFNPFFIRASVYWTATACCARPVRRCVSIPSSSGHQFTGRPGDDGQHGQHQRFNPFFIRASVY